MFLVLQFLQSLLALLGIWGLAVPADLILHERNALALDGVCKDGLGLAGHGRLGERGLDGVKIVAVGQLDEVEAEGARAWRADRQGS